MRTKSLTALCALVAMTSLAGCGKSANSGTNLDQQQPPGDGPQQSCSVENQVRWQFIQPEPTVSQAVDILFVVDTSVWMTFRRWAHAEDIPEWLSHLPQGADYRVAVMEAHGGDSDWTGKLYSEKGVPAVLSTQNMTVTEMQKDLKENICSVANDPGPSGGRTGMYSFLRSLGADRLPEIKSQGFYRPDAALSVIFVSNHFDLCYPPNLHGMKNFPDYSWDPLGTEMAAYKKYCLNGDGTEAVTPAKVLSSIQSLKPGLPYSIGAVTHVDRSKVPIIFGGTIGHGLIELTELAGQVSGRQVEITEENYTPDLDALTDLSHLIQHLQSSFDLSAQSGL